MFRAAEREQLTMTLLASHRLRTPPSRHIRAVQVPADLDGADTVIVKQLRPGDLVVTQDIPLAARVLDKGRVALNPRGELYAPDNMAGLLSLRNFID